MKMNNAHIRLTSSDRFPQYLYVRAELDSDGTGVWLHIKDLHPMHMTLENYRLMLKTLNSVDGN